MLAKIKTIMILILMGGIAYLLFQGSTFLDSKLENKPTQWVQDEPVIAPVTKTPEQIDAEIRAVPKERAESKIKFEIDPDSPEVSNVNYSWLKSVVVDCYPGAKADIKEAFINDDVIRENEYNFILSKCVAENNRKDASKKAELRNMVQ